jgi:hypothetical protein
VPAKARTCPVCWNSFTPAARNGANHTYCTDRCRAEAGRRRRRAGDTSTTPAAKPRRPEPAAQRDCPHCGQPVTIIALLTTPQIAGPQVAAPQPAVATPEMIPLHPVHAK